MKKGIIFTKDKTEIDVFFLKAHVPPELGWQLGHQIGDGTKENPILVDDETGEAIMEDDKDCCGELKESLTEFDVNENSAGEGALGCPVGHKGESGQRGIDEERMYPLILESLEKFSESCCSVDSEVSREVLADGIAKKITRYMWNK